MEFNINSLNAMGHLPEEAKNILVEALKKIETIVERENSRKAKGFLKPGTPYWTFQHNNRGITCMRWFDEKIDKFLYEIGEVFKSEDEALFALERAKVRADLERFSNVKTADFYGKNNPCCIVYRNGEIVVYEMDKYFNVGDGIYFKTAHDAMSAIDIIGADRLKKYYFGM